MTKKERADISLWAVWNILCSGYCLVRTASVGEKSLKGVLFGYSLSRLAMMGVLLLFLLSGVITLLRSENARAFFLRPYVKPAALLIAYLSAAAFLITGYMASPAAAPYFERICFLLLFFLSLGISTAALSARLRGGSRLTSPEGLRQLLRKTCVYTLIGALILLLVYTTGIGIVPDTLDWQPIGMVVYPWEIGISLLAAIGVVFLLRRVPEKFKDGLIFLLLWFGTALFWISVPTMQVLDHSYFMEITAPDMLPYPVSDCAGYGVWAESVLAGLGFKTAIATRQFFILILAFFLSLTKGNILRTIDCITVLCALIPPCLYLLGRRLHSREAGVMAAGMAVWREYNTLCLAPSFMVSDSKMWLTDLPAALFMIILVTCCISSLEKPRSLWRIVLAGCMAGLACTLRSQFFLLLPAALLFFLLQKKPRNALVFAGCALLVTAPWLIRGKVLTGSIVFDDPMIHSTELARRFSDGEPVGSITIGEDESVGEYADRNKRRMTDFLRERPGYVLHFILSHFMNNEISAFSLLPFGTDASLTIRDVTDSAYQNAEARLFDAGNLPAVLLCLFLSALGLSAASRCGAAGRFPFVMSTLYLFFTACGRYSGWRFALPADWITALYFSIGCFEAIRLIRTALSGAERCDDEVRPESEVKARPGLAVAFAAFFLILGLLPVLVGVLIPDRVSERSRDENLALLQDEQIDPETAVINGRMLYPRFFYGNEGLSSGHPWPPYEVRDYSRLGFILLNRENTYVILPLDDVPAFIGNARDVIITGHYQDDIFLADSIFFEDDGRVLCP